MIMLRKRKLPTASWSINIVGKNLLLNLLCTTFLHVFNYPCIFLINKFDRHPKFVLPTTCYNKFDRRLS